MSLITLHFKKIAPVAVAAATMDGVLDTIYTALGAATYYDASARTPGTGSAWTVSRYQSDGVTEAVYASPPAEYGLAQRVILAGCASAKSPTMRTPDTWATNNLLMGINKNSGAYNAWDDALPFTSGQWFGYWKLATAVDTAAYVHIIESEEILVVGIETTSGTLYCGIAGALIDAYSTNALDCESDGRLYGMITSGVVLPASILHLTTKFLDHYNSNTGAHAGVFIPGTANIYICVRSLIYGTTAGANSLILSSGAPVTLPIFYSGYSSKQFYGLLREIMYCPISRTGRRLAQSGADKGYVLGSSSNSDHDCILFEV